MKIFLTTGSVDDVVWGTETGLIDGVVTTPTSLQSAGEDGYERDVLERICRATPLPVCASVASVTSEDIYRDGRELARISDQIVVQVPLLEEAVTAVRRLRADGVRVAATLVYTAAQALLVAKAGAFMVQIPVSHLDAVGLDGGETVRDISAVLLGQAMECDVLAALPSDPVQFARAARGGADGAVVTLPVLKSLLLHPLTDRGVDQFLRELSAHRRPRQAV